MSRRWLRWPGFWATGCHSGQGMGGVTVWLTFRKKQTEQVKSVYIMHDDKRQKERKREDHIKASSLTMSF